MEPLSSSGGGLGYEQMRLVSWRLKVLQHADEGERRVTETCRHFGISRTTFCKWKKRYEALGAAGVADRPRCPHRSPRATAAEVVSKIHYLRKTTTSAPSNRLVRLWPASKRTRERQGLRSDIPEGRFLGADCDVSSCRIHR